MANYYFLVSLLPELEIGHLPNLDFTQLQQLIKVNVTRQDQEVIKRFLQRIDFENFRAYWAKEPLDPHGNLNAEQIEESLLNQTWPKDKPFPSFLLDYLDKYHNDEDRLVHFPQVMSQFYQYQAEEEEGFVAQYSAFEREMLLVLMGFRAKMLGRDIIYELQYEDVKDPIVAQIIAQKDAKVFEPPFEYKELKPIFEECSDQPLELHKALTAYQFAQIIERWGGTLFSIERILNYLARLLLVERWVALDMQKGMTVIDKIEESVGN